MFGLLGVISETANAFVRFQFTLTHVFSPYPVVHQEAHHSMTLVKFQSPLWPTAPAIISRRGKLEGVCEARATRSSLDDAEDQAAASARIFPATRRLPR